MPLNVLIVDDSAAMRSIIQKTLTLSGLEIEKIHHAGNGQEALEILDGNWVDLALVDINMPVMDGETFINRVREDEELSELPIVVVSTESSETRIESLRARDVEFIHKPFAPETLRETVFSITGAQHGTCTLPGSDLDF